jgi:hypothetical protein
MTSGERILAREMGAELKALESLARTFLQDARTIAARLKRGPKRHPSAHAMARKKGKTLMKKLIALPLFCVALAAMLFTAACNTNQAITTVEAVVAASEAVVNSLPKIPASTKTEVTAYLTDVSAAVTCTNAELASGDTGTTRALKITACFSTVNVSNISASAQSYVAAVNAAVQALLAIYAAPAASSSTAVLSASQGARVASIQTRNTAVASAVK